jgi:hypothetical protein
MSTPLRRSAGYGETGRAVRTLRRGVWGEGGRPGSFEHLLDWRVDVEVVGIAAAAAADWPRQVGSTASTGCRSRSSGSRPSFRLDGLVVAAPVATNAAPVTTNDLHRLSIDARCHVADVSVGAALNRAVVGLGPAAESAGVTVIAMAGLAPGLTGVLGRQVLQDSSGAATRAEVCLVQARSGVAGEQGARDMLDLLTDAAARYRRRAVLDPATGVVVHRRLFDLRNGEVEFVAVPGRLEVSTGFDGAALDSAVRGLRIVRRIAPPVFTAVRDRLAAQKAKSNSGDEEIVLSAVASGPGARRSLPGPSGSDPTTAPPLPSPRPPSSPPEQQACALVPVT